MKLSELDRLPSFALLGPGFGETPLVIGPLRTGEGDPTVVLLRYEETADQAQSWTGPVVARAIEIDVPPVSIEPNIDGAGYMPAVESIRSAVAAGDVYQVNLTLRAKLPAVSGAQLFATFCRRAMPQFAAWVRLPDGTEFVSASPEMFFTIEGRAIRSQPMKGTAPSDGLAFLERSTKDAAELAMITDLIRNDLTQVCEPRSVHVESARRFLQLPYAVQAVSDVAGTLRADASLRDVLAALHPGGSITGAPKQSAIRMIRALESSPRGVYCGTLGLVEGDRSVFSLLIRTSTKTDEGWTYGVGGGIVWDSDPAQEWEEIQVKLGALR